jgi:hypothetical protein
MLAVFTLIVDVTARRPADFVDRPPAGPPAAPEQRPVSATSGPSVRTPSLARGPARRGRFGVS